MVKYQKYAEYKDSGVEWLGEIPLHWNAVNLGYLFDITSSKRVFEDQWKSEGVPFYRAREIVRLKKDQDYQNDLFISDILYAELRKTYGVPQIGDILVTAVGTLGVTYIVENQKEFYFKDGNLIWLKTNNKCDSTFINYCYESFVIKYQMYRDNMGATVGTYTIENAKKNKIFMPPWDEQLAITRFLNDQTQVIDTLITKQENLIELLKEKRQAVISHAVTKGLNLNVPMKDSGVEWLGDVPEHWSVSALGYYSYLNTGATPDRSNSNYWEGDIPWIKTGEVRYDTIFSAEESITDLALKQTSVQLSPPGTLLMAMYGQGITRGRVALLGVSATYNQACVAINPNSKVWNEYLKLFFMAAYHAIRDGGNETSQMNLNADIVKKFKITIPPLDEQHQIVENLNKEIPKIDSLIEKAESVIQLMQERRAALISAAVTGKIDVRNWQHPNQNNNKHTELSA